MNRTIPSMKRLGVNIDHVATLRQVRGTRYPDPCEAAFEAIQGGADQITIHLREDRRHIADDDLHRLKASVTVPLNLEMAAVTEITAIACEVRPDVATLVPERREELTTEGGLKVRGNKELPAVISRLKDAGIEVSLFIDPSVDEIEASRDLGVDAVELHTGTYCNAGSRLDAEQELARLKEAAGAAHVLNLRVAAGHGLNVDNVISVAQHIPLIEEYNIGHSIVARAVFLGLEAAVREMKEFLEVS